jgi:hypothetical protein
MRLLLSIVLIIFFLPKVEGQIKNHQLEKATQQGDFVVSGGGDFSRVYLAPNSINLSSFNNDVPFITDNETITVGGEVAGSGAINTVIGLTIASNVIDNSNIVNGSIRYEDFSSNIIENASSTVNTLSPTDYFLMNDQAGSTLSRITAITMGKFFRSFILPTGGSSGQVLAKNSSTDFDYSWQTVSGGGGGITAIDNKGTVSGTVNCDFTSNRAVTMTVSSGITLTFTNGSSDHLEATLAISQGTSASISWPSNIVFPGGNEPTLSGQSGAVDVFTFEWMGTGIGWMMNNAVYDVK